MSEKIVMCLENQHLVHGWAMSIAELLICSSGTQRYLKDKG
jgi:hypothetical protein